MTGAQIAVIAVLGWQDKLPSAAIVSIFLVVQIGLMTRLLRDPARYAPWYNATGVSLYVFGMLATALGLGGYL